MPKSIAVPPQRYRAAAFFNKNTRQVRGEEAPHVCTHAYDPARVSPQINANRKEPPGDANQPQEAARSRLRVPSKPPPTSAAASLLPAFWRPLVCGFSLLPFFHQPLVFFCQRELSNVTFVRRERGAAGNKDWSPITVRPARPRGRELHPLMREGGK